MGLVGLVITSLTSTISGESQDEEVLSNYKIKETGTRGEVYKYNPLNLNVEIQEPNVGVTQIEYDPMGRVVEVTDAD